MSEPTSKSPQDRKLPVITDEMEQMMKESDARLRAMKIEPGEQATLAMLDELPKSR